MLAKRNSRPSGDSETQSEPKRRKINRVATTHIGLDESSLSEAPAKVILEPCGIIERIILKNVFCHDNLDFDSFIPQINLLQGANGSGKSSIVAAIIAGLGGTSKSTDRGKNLKSLIQNGKQWASIEIHLRNRGYLAHKPEQFGNKVIIERRIAISGSSSYKIKAERGNIISTKKEDLSRILECLNIQVDNPVLILSQERAKTFLSSTDPSTLFKFYMQATQLQQWSDNYKSITTDINSANTLITQKTESLQVFEKQVKELEKRVEAIKCLEEKRNQVSNLKKARAWAEVDEEENKIKKTETKKGKFEKILNQYAAAIQKIEAKRDEEGKKKSDAELQLVKLAAMSKCLAEKLNLAKSTHEDAAKSLREKRNHEKNLASELYERELDVTTLKEKLDSDNNSATATWETTVAALNQEKEKLKTLEVQVRQCLETEQTHCENISSSLRDSEDTYVQQTNEEKGIRDHLSNLRAQLKSVEGQKDNLTVFGAYMPALINEINSTCGFRNRPIGPVGMHIKVKDKQWVHIVESVSQKMLLSFIVSCRQDYTLLDRIFNKMIPRGTTRPQVTVTEFRRQVHDVRRFETGNDRYFSMWSVIQTDNVQVANALLDQLQLESILLIPTADEATALLVEQNLVPPNCKYAMTLNGDTIYPDPNFRIYGGRDNRNVRYLQVSVEDKIRDLRDSIQSTEHAIKQTNMETLELRKKLEELKEEKGKSSYKIRKYTKELGDCQSQLRELKNRVIPAPPDVFQLKNDLEETTQLKLKAEEKLLELTRIIREKEKILKEAEKKYLETKKECQEINKQASEFEEISCSAQEEHLKKKKELIALANKKQEYQIMLAELVEEIESMHKFVKEKIDDVSRVDPIRIQLNKSKVEIERELQALQNIIQKEESSHGTLDQVSNDWRCKKDKFNKTLAEARDQKSFISVLKKSLEDRRKQLINTKFITRVLLRNSFIEKIKHRHLIGEIDVNYKEETLKILMKKDTQDNNHVLQSLQMMSGGERSFATVSFILALWDFIVSPIRIMDEFDIFMDVVSRNQCVEMIIKAAKAGVQYIMVSPLEYRLQSDKVQVFRLMAPERLENNDESEEV